MTGFARVVLPFHRFVPLCRACAAAPLPPRAARDLLAALPDGCDAAAGAAYWRAAAEYHRVRGPAADFYHAALAWLARTPLEVRVRARTRARA